MNTRTSVVRVVLVTVVFLSAAVTIGIAQTARVPGLPPGEPMASAFDIPEVGRVYWDGSIIVLEYMNLFAGGLGHDALLGSLDENGTTYAQRSDKIVRVHYDKKTKIIWAVSEKGVIYRITFNPKTMEDMTGKMPKLGDYEFCSDIKGDALYLRTTSRFFVSRDSANSWQVDTSGLAGKNPTSFDLDTLQYVYITTTSGIYRQHPDSMTWVQLKSYTGTTPSMIYVDRRNRIFVGTSGKTYLSSDRGTSWNIDTAGSGNTSLATFWDDAFGNVYAISSDKTKLYRSTAGSGPWTRIEQPIVSQVPDLNSFNSYSNPLLYSISGDTVLKLGTGIGMFASSDQGSTWTPSNAALPSMTNYGYWRTTDGKTLAYTALGIFSRSTANPTWQKVYPQSGSFAYPSSNREILYQDKSGSFYAVGPRLNTASITNPPTPIRSTDGGTTWFPDTAGFAVVGTASTFQYYVDENGTQYLTAFNTTTTPVMVSKRIGQPWSIDTTGYWCGSTNRTVNAFCSDRRGNMYIATSGNPSSILLTRPSSGGAWVPDTAGIGKALVYAIARDKAGTLFCAGLDPVSYSFYLWKKVGLVWQQIPGPSNLPGCGAFAFSVDSTNALFGVFGDFNNWRGVYYTKNEGTSWTTCGIDYTPIRALISFGDTTFALTKTNGIYKMTSTGSSAAEPRDLAPRAFALYNNFPNPFNPSTTIRFALPERSHVRLIVFNILGQRVAELANGEFEAGVQSLRWMATTASGVYFYSLEAVSTANPNRKFSETRKMMLLR